MTRDQNGRPVALVVDKDGKVERRQLVTDRAIGDAWLVTQGLAAGDRVIVEGLQKVRPGASVTPVPVVPHQAGRDRAEGSVAQFFIDRPIFAWVIAIIIMIAGGLSIVRLPVSQYPAIAPPAISDQRDVSGRVGADARGDRHPGDRAADERARWAALPVVVE